MNNNKPTVTDKLNYCIYLIQLLPNLVIGHAAELGHLRQHQEELDGRTCTGTTHWRDKNAPGKSAKLYILHRTDQQCPIHGKPSPGRRNRIYIGNKPDRIADALAAIERHAEYGHLQRQLLQLQEDIARVTYRVKSIYWSLNFSLPTPPEDEP